MPRARHVFEFGAFQLDLTERILFRSGRPIRLAPKLLDTLAVLVQNSGHTVQKDELIKEVWPDTFVEENNLNKSVSVLRKVLGDAPGKARLIETVPKRGYRFLSAVRESWINGGALPKPVSPSASVGEPRAEAFVGRTPELKQLGELLDRATSGSGRAVFVTGEAGIGKTALVREFLRRAQAEYPELVLGIGRCVEQYGPGEAYLPFLELLGNLLSGLTRESVATALRAAAPSWCQQFPSTFNSSEEIEHLKRETIGATKERMLREMGEALEMLSTGFPVVLLLEDLQWADPSSTDLIRLLCQRIARQRLLMIGTYRPDELALKDHLLKKYKWEMDAHGQCEELWLGMLGQNDVSLLLDLRFTPNRFPKEMAGLIHGKTEGHPLFTASLVQYLLERRYMVKLNDGHWGLTHAVSEMDLEVPESAQGMIRRKLDALEGEDRRTLEYASIEGEEFTSTVLAGLLGTDELALEERIDRLFQNSLFGAHVGRRSFPGWNGCDTISFRTQPLSEPIVRGVGAPAPRAAAPKGGRRVDQTLRRSGGEHRRAACRALPSR